MKNLIISLTILTSLFACEPVDNTLEPTTTPGVNVINNTVDPSDWSVIVSVVDTYGQPLSPDDIWWYLTPGTDDTYAEYDLECIDADCTVFGVPIEVTGDFYIAANWEREAILYCWYLGYDASPINVDLPTDLSSWQPIRLTLELETEQMACQ